MLSTADIASRLASMAACSCARCPSRRQHSVPCPSPSPRCCRGRLRAAVAATAELRRRWLGIRRFASGRLRSGSSLAAGFRSTVDRRLQVVEQARVAVVREDRPHHRDPQPHHASAATPANRFRLTNQAMEVLPCDESSRKRRSASHKPLDRLRKFSRPAWFAACTRANSSSAARLARRRASGSGAGALMRASFASNDFSFIGHGSHGLRWLPMCLRIVCTRQEMVDSDTPRMAPASAWLMPSACTSSAVSFMPSPSFASCASTWAR